jgi:hypothetical protein
MTPQSRLMYGGRFIESRFSGPRSANNCSVSQPSSLNAFQGDIGAGGVINLAFSAVVVAEIKFGGVAAQVSFRAMLVSSDHSFLEHAVKAFNRVGVDDPRPIFPGAVTNEIVFSEVLGEVSVLPGFVGHDVGSGVHIGLDDGEQIGGGGSTNMEGQHPRALGTTFLWA